MKQRVILIVTAFVMMLTSCESNQIDADKDDLGEPKGDRNLLVQKAGTSEATFLIDGVKFSSAAKDTLEVTVLHPADCDGKFDFYWDGSVALSFPPQVYLVLKYEGSCPTSELSTKTTLTLDLESFLNHPDLNGNAIIHVINGSVSHASNDKNVSSN